MDLNLALAAFAGVVLLLNAFSLLLSRVSLPAPLLALLAGVVLGPAALGLVRIEEFGIGENELLEHTARLTLAVGLTGVALRLPSGYWRRRWKWVAASILLGMVVMFAVAGLLIWALVGLPVLVALLIAGIITPTDPIVTTPIVTGTIAQENVPEPVRLDLSSESGVNDGLGYLFVFAPLLLLTLPTGDAWGEFLVRTLLWEVIAGAAIGAAVGAASALLFRFVRRHRFMEETSYLGFFLPFSLLTLGALSLLRTDGVLAVFVAAAVFGQMVSDRDEEREMRLDEAVNRFFALPAFLLLGLALPLSAWGRMGPWVALALLAALLVRRVVALWTIRPLIASLHDRAQTLFMSWFGAVGVSALYYATVAERRTGENLFPYVSLVIVLSLVVHGLTATPFSLALRRARERRSA